MAGRRRSARQRAALRKAQYASARKRRNRGKWARRAKTAGSIAGGIATSAALYHVNAYARDPGRAIKHYKATKNYVDVKRGKSPKLTPALSSKPRKRISYVAGQRAHTAAFKRRSRVR